jgi:hypothetical protein
MVATPVVDLLDRAPASQDRSGGEDLGVQLPGRPGRPGVAVRGEAPVMQPSEAVTARIVRFVVRTRDVPIE